ncbi:MAG TPA: hydroxymethylbilane synthase [Vicinamibacterales bacterium]|nr:hydroxymethylbilane synthase [Vicinamibacterales bacterium]
MTPPTLRLGTRGSQLALYQANAVARLIADAGGPPCALTIIRTSGDRLQDRPLSEVGGKRLFVKEIEDALLRNEIDLAVHSSKDMPALLPDGLEIAGVLAREDPRDAVVLPTSKAVHASSLDDLVAALGQAPAIGTASVRRVALLTRLFPNARFSPMRGNLDTRLRKLDDGEHDALVLAAAGLRRLGFESRISLALPLSACIPAPGQGIIAIEIRSDDDRARRAVEPISDRVAAEALDAERGVVDALGGGCQTPIGALATPVRDHQFELIAAVVALDGSRMMRTVVHGPRSEARALGVRAAGDLLAQGADEILADARRVQAQNERNSP